MIFCMTFGSVIPAKRSPSSIILPSPSRRKRRTQKGQINRREGKKRETIEEKRKRWKRGQRGRVGRGGRRDARRLTSPPLLRCQRFTVSRIQRLGVMCQRNMKLIINYISFLFRYILSCAFLPLFVSLLHRLRRPALLLFLIRLMGFRSFDFRSSRSLGRTVRRARLSNMTLSLSAFLDVCEYAKVTFPLALRRCVRK